MLGMGTYLWGWWLVRSRFLQTLQDIADAISCPSELNSKILLQNTALTCAIQYGKVKLVVTWKLYLFPLVFRVLEDAMQRR